MPGSTQPGDGSFVHLHVHSEYSMLDGAARIADLFSGCEHMGMPAIAITDHGNTFGAYEFYKASKSSSVKPIVGIEAYLTPKTHRSDRRRVLWGDGGSDDVGGGGAFTHLTIWAENTPGMHNLFRLSSRASLEGYFYKPRIDRELLARHASGLIATTGCPGGEVQTYLRLGRYHDALASAAEFRDLFGAGNYYVELMDHGITIERRVRDDLLRIARELNLPLVATNDLHYAQRADAAAHEVLLCVQTGSTMAEGNRFKFEGDSYYLKSPAEMRALFAELPEACDNTLAIAERCEVSFTEGNGTYMPRYPCPEGETEESWFVHEVDAGLHRRYPGGIPDPVRKQADFETRVIISMGFAGYFLVVADFVNWAGLAGLVASFFSIIYAYSRQLFALSRAGYLPKALSLTSGRNTPWVALLVPGTIGFVLAGVLEANMGPAGGALLINIAVFGATVSYVLLNLSHIMLRRSEPDLERPYRTPGGVVTTGVGLVLSVVAVVATFFVDIKAAGITAAVFVAALAYFWFYSRHHLVASAPEEEFASISDAESGLK